MSSSNKFNWSCTLLSAIFFGAAIYINIAEQPVRLGLDDGSALAQCRPADILTIEFAALMSSGSALRGG